MIEETKRLHQMNEERLTQIEEGNIQLKKLLDEA
jgi:predicted nucleic acid-binding Zn ribbon protein